MKKNLIILLSVLLIGLVSADIETSGCFGSGMMSGSYGVSGMFFGWIFSILVIAALVLLIVWLIKQIQKK